MIDKHVWWTWWFWWPLRQWEGIKKTEKWNNNIWRPEKVEWRVWYTLAEVEELLKKEKQKRTK